MAFILIQSGDLIMAGGFRPIQDQSGHSYTGKVVTYDVVSGHATLLAVGDLVIVTGTASATTGLAGADAAAAGGLITGPIVAIDPNISNLEQAGLPAGTAGTIKVAVDNDLLMEAEISNGSIAITDVQGNADIVATAASLAGGLANSNMTIDAAAFAAATAQIRIVSLNENADVGSGVTVICRINESTTAGVVGV